MFKSKTILYMTQTLALLITGFTCWVMMTFLRIAMVSMYGVRLDLGRDWSDLLKAFWLGARFDLTVVCYILIFTFFFGVLPSLIHVGWKKITPILLLILFSILFIILTCDLGYYSYFQDHLNILVFGFFEDDTVALLKLAWRNYPVIWLSLGTIAGIFLFHKCIQKIFKFSEQYFLRHNRLSFIHHPLHRILLFSLFLVAGLSIGARGGFGLFPLGPQDTVISSDPFINHLAYNGAHSLVRAFKLRKIQSASWDTNAKYFGYSNFRKAYADYFEIPESQVPENPLELLATQTSYKGESFQKPHVVLIVMESLGAYWLQYHSAKFNLLGEYEKHIRSDIFTDHFLPATNSTIGSLGSLLAGVTHRPDGAFLTESMYLQVPFRTSPAMNFKNQGYTTRFIYGGNPGWRDVNKFALHQGFDSVEGEVEIQKKLTSTVLEKHDWGIFDEDLFKYVELTLAEATTPQFLVVMTTTNHPPYQLPKSYQPLNLEWPKDLESRLIVDKDLALDRFKTYQYSNEQMGLFLTRIKSSSLGQHTIIASTADHGFMVINFNESEQLQKWNVPFYLYIPEKIAEGRSFTNDKFFANSNGITKKKLPNKTGRQTKDKANQQISTKMNISNWKPTENPAKKINRLQRSEPLFGSHLDIWPTLYELSLSQAKVFRLGDNLLEPKPKSMAFHSSRVAFDPFGGIFAGKDQEVHYYHWKKNSLSRVSDDFFRANFNELEVGESNEHGQRLAKRYKALMSLLDHYLYEEKKSKH